MRQRIHLFFRLPPLHARPQAAIDPAAMHDLRPRRQARFDGKRHPQVRNQGPHASEIGRSDADHGHIRTVQLKASPKEARIARESPFPEVVTDQQHRLRRWRILLRKEGAPHYGLNAKHFKIVARDHYCRDRFGAARQHSRQPETGCAHNPAFPLRRAATPAHREDIVGHGGQPRETPVVFPVPGIVGIREGGIAVTPRDLHHPFGLLRLQGAQRHGVVSREHRGIDTDTHRQGQHRYRCETGILAQRAHGVVHVLEEGIDQRQTARGAMRFLQLGAASQLDLRGAASLFRSHAAADVVLREHRQVRFELFIEIPIQAARPQEGAYPRKQILKSRQHRVSSSARAAAGARSRPKPAPSPWPRRPVAFARRW